MHRSGTTLITKLAERLGLFVGRGMMDAALFSAEEKRKTTEAGRLRVHGQFTKEVMRKALTDVYGGAVSGGV